MAGKPSGRGRTLLILILILLLGGMLRFYRLGAKGLWLDEACILHVSSYPLGRLIEKVRETEAHPPLYPLLLKLCSGPFAPTVKEGGTEVYFPQPRRPSEFRTRSFSAVCGIALIALIFFQCGDAPRKQRYIAALLVACSAYLIYYSQEARLHSLVALLSLLSVYALGKATKINRPLAWGGFALVTCLALYTYYYFFFLILAEVIFLAVLIWRKKRRELLLPFLLSLLLILILFFPWVSVLKARIDLVLASESAAVEGQASEFYTQAARSPGEYLFGPFYQPGRSGSPGIDAARLGAALLLIAFLAASAFRSPRKEICLLYLLWLVVPILGVICLPLRLHSLESKHLILISPALYLLVSEGIASLTRKKLAAIVIAIILAFNLTSLPRYYSHRYVKEDWKRVAESLEEKAKPGDLILMDPGYLGFPFDYYYRGGTARAAMPSMREVPLGGAVWEIMKEIEAEYPRLWLISGYSPVALRRPDTFRAVVDYYEEKDRWEYQGEKGTIVVRLYETLQAWSPSTNSGETVRGVEDE